jgi:general secretion pathway protein H
MRRNQHERNDPRLTRQRASGFTLIEIMVALAIIALVSSLGVGGLRSVAKSDLRAATAHLSGAIRYLFDRASTTGKFHRLVIDLNAGRYWAEVSDDRFYIPHDAESDSDVRKREDDEAKQDEDEKVKADEKNKRFSGSENSGGTFDMSKLEIGDFRPKRVRFGAFKEMALKPVTVKPGTVKIAGVYTPRMTDEVTSGRAYIYFFPMGQTEAAIVHLTDAKGEAPYSIVVHPITGRVKIQDRYVPPPIAERYDDQGNRIDQ